MSFCDQILSFVLHFLETASSLKPPCQSWWSLAGIFFAWSSAKVVQRIHSMQNSSCYGYFKKKIDENFNLTLDELFLDLLPCFLSYNIEIWSTYIILLVHFNFHFQWPWPIFCFCHYIHEIWTRCTVLHVNFNFDFCLPSPVLLK